MSNIDSRLFLASTIAERLTVLNTARNRADTEAGQRHLARWRRAVFHSDTAFDAWSAEFGLDGPGWQELLGVGADALAAAFHEPPEWLAELAHHLAGDEPDDTLAERLGPLVPLAPLVDAARAGLHERVARLAEDAGHPALAGTLGPMVDGLPTAALSRVALRVFVLHMHVVAANGELRGDTPRDRFDHYLHLLRHSDLGPRLLRRYPVLVRETERVLRHWQGARTEFVAHLLADLPMVTRRRPELRPDTLREVTFDHGDAHRSGRSVAMVRFADEDRLVYKPRSVLVDQRFQELLAWTTDRGFEPALAPLWVLDRGDHGWMQHVRHGPCRDRAEAERYYRRLGGHLALLHVVYARDVHRENIIAAGDMPYVVDLEGLFHSDPAYDGEVISEPVHNRRVVVTTVLATGLLPTPVGYLEQGVARVSDLSGVSAPNQFTAQQVYAWQDHHTDEMRLRRDRVELPPAHNVVRIGDVPTALGEYAAVLEDGFADMYRLLRDHRAELLARDGPLLPCAAGTTRVILRDTQFYSDVLDQTYHPDLLQDAVDREHYLSQTLEAVLGIAGEERIIDSERRQLAAGDIPIFHAGIDGTELVGGDGTRIPDALHSSGMAACLDRVRGLGEEDLARQRWVIRAAVAARDIDARHPALPARYGTISTDQSPPPLFRTAVTDIGDLLLDQAIEIDGRCGWLGLQFMPRTDQWQLSAVGADLYSGRSGIALYLTHLAAFTGAQRFVTAARRLSHDLAERLAALPAARERGMDVTLLGLTGMVDGPLCALAEWARLNDEPGLALDAFGAVAGLLRDAVGTDTEHDLVMGNASTILALAWLYRVCPHPDIPPIVATAAEHLAGARFRPDEGGTAWRPDRLDGPPLTGASHGASGIALALAVADDLLSTRTHRATVLDALCFERARFDPALPGWPDLRQDANPDSALIAWCHGSPGIGLTRLAMFRLAPVPAVAADLELAVDTTVRHYDGQRDGERVRMANLSLCHGELGNVGFLAAAARATDDAVLTRRVRGLTHAIASVAQRHGYICGVPNGLSNPGLMTGLAGIGYGMLRVLARDQVPEVLVMAADH